MKLNLSVSLILLLASQILQADELTDISNFRQYNPTFASSGQPTTEQLKLVADNGVQRVIYLAFTDNETAIEDEDRTVKSLGMEYVHIPVNFDNPTLSDFQHFAAVMQSSPEMKTLLHCQINLRASTFSFLYRVIHLKVPMENAIQDLQGVWAPNEAWYLFTKRVLSHHGFDADCDGCDWGASEFTDQQ
jgi:protein tyrosine phosphatase (PTP) superfamily phosphohydrolase (DUF442 family)